MPRINFRKCTAAVLVFAMIGILSACSENSNSSALTPQPSQVDASQEEASGITATEPEATNGIPTDENDVTSEKSNILIA